jgi:hypothetical protein
MSRKFIRAAASAALALPLAGIAQQAPASAPTGVIYRSVFDGYRSHREQPVQSWRAANDLAGRLGGWQAYAREGQGGPVAGSGPAASASAGQSGAKAP